MSNRRKFMEFHTGRETLFEKLDSPHSTMQACEHLIGLPFHTEIGDQQRPGAKPYRRA